MNWRPGNCAPFAPPSLRPCTHAIWRSSGCVALLMRFTFPTELPQKFASLVLLLILGECLHYLPGHTNGKFWEIFSNEVEVSSRKIKNYWELHEYECGHVHQECSMFSMRATYICYKNIKHIFINKYIDNSFCNVCWCSLYIHMSPYCTTQHN